MLALVALSGIQGYLFDVRESGGGQARSLRHRSFRIQLTAECIALRLLRAAEPSAGWERLLFCAAAKTCLDFSGLNGGALDAVRDAAAEIQQALLGETHGRLRLAVAFQERSGDFAADIEKAQQKLRAEKLRSCALAAIRNGRWTDGGLVMPEAWSADRGAEVDAELGRQLLRARWMAVEVEKPGGPSPLDGWRTLGVRVRLLNDEPAPSPGLLSCSNLARPETPPKQVQRRLFHVHHLTRHVPRGPDGELIEFASLAARARGAAMLGVLKADADSLGDAVRRLPAGDGPARLKALSNALDCFFAETLEGEMASAGSPWANIYTVYSGGDDLLAVGPWDLILDFAGHIQELFTQRFGPGAAASPSPIPLTVSAAVTIVKPKYPLHLAARQADTLLQRAKNECAPRASQPKDQCSALGQLWKWRDHGAIARTGKQLADWVQGAGSGRAVVERGWLGTLLELALLRGGQAGPKYAGIPPAAATSRLAYHVERNWPRKKEDPRDDVERAGNAARQWIEDILSEFEHLESSRRPDAVFLLAVARYAILATRPSSDKE